MNSNYEQFLLDRKSGLGGSDISAIMSINPWKTPLDVYFDKIHTGLDEDTDKPVFARGRRAEKYILEEYSDHTNYELETDIPMFRDKEYPFLIGNVDAKVKGKNIIVEAKSVGSGSSRWHGIPAYYKTQLAHYASLTNCEYVDMPVLFDRWEYAQYTYYRDEEFEATNKQAAINFWNNHVLKRIPPDPVNLEDIKNLYASSTPVILEATEELKKAVDDFNALEMQRKMIEAKMLNVKCMIMNHMASSEVLKDNDRTLVTWKTSARKTFDVTSFKLQYPELYNKYIIENNVRRFIVC